MKKLLTGHLPALYSTQRSDFKLLHPEFPRGVKLKERETMGFFYAHRAVLLIPLAMASPTAPVGARGGAQNSAPNVELVRKALAAEAAAAQDTTHPVRYQLRKWSPRLTTTKDLVETRDGQVAMLVAANDKPLPPQEQAKEQGRLNSLLFDPGKQRHRKQSQDQDTARAVKVIRALPNAFIYTYAGPVNTGDGVQVERFTFVPDPHFDPPDLETEVLTSAAGEIWIDPAHMRVTHLQANLQQDVDFGWGILGRLAKGGWITIDQAEVLPGTWRITKFQMKMSARVLFRTKQFETTEDESQFAPVPPGMSYADGITLLRARAESR